MENATFLVIFKHCELTWLNWLQNQQLLKQILVRILNWGRDQFWWWLRCVLANFHPHLSRLHLKRRWRCSEMGWLVRLSRPPKRLLHLRSVSPESSLPEKIKKNLRWGPYAVVEREHRPHYMFFEFPMIYRKVLLIDHSVRPQYQILVRTSLRSTTAHGPYLISWRWRPWLTSEYERSETTSISLKNQ